MGTFAESNTRYRWVLTIILLVHFLSQVTSKSILSKYPDYQGDSPNDQSALTEPKCATVWNASRTCLLGLDRNERYEISGLYNFVPVSVDLRSECRLTMIDDQQKVTQVKHSGPLEAAQCWNYCWNRPLSYACCECSGCLGATTPDHPSACAVIYEHQDCSGCLGQVMTIYNASESFLMHPDWDKKISSILVRPGCLLEVFSMANFLGNYWVVSGIQDNLGQQWNDQISSYRCKCGFTPDIPQLTSSQPVNPTAPSTSLTTFTETAEPVQKTTEPATETTQPGKETTEPEKEISSTTVEVTSLPTTVTTTEAESTAKPATTTEEPETSTTTSTTTEETPMPSTSSSTQPSSSTEDEESPTSPEVTTTTEAFILY